MCTISLLISQDAQQEEFQIMYTTGQAAQELSSLVESALIVTPVHHLYVSDNFTRCSTWRITNGVDCRTQEKLSRTLSLSISRKLTLELDTYWTFTWYLQEPGHVFDAFQICTCYLSLVMSKYVLGTGQSMHTESIPFPFYRPFISTHKTTKTSTLMLNRYEPFQNLDSDYT